MSIRYIKHDAINRQKYQKCLEASYNATAFAYPWYLDLVCEDWNLLVEGDYQTVCPVPVLKRFGFTIVRQPPLTPFLGVFSSSHLPPCKVDEFMKAIPYKSVRLTLNHFNRLKTPSRNSHHHVPVLDLILPYELLKQKYAPEIQKTLTLPDHTFVLPSIRTDEYIKFKREVEKTAVGSYMLLTRIMNYALRYKSAGIYTVYSSMNELIAALFLIKANNRVCLIETIETPEGQENHALFRALDHIIKTNCESNLTLELPFGNETLTSIIAFESQYCPAYRKGTF